jgi:hypothetical protein
VSSFAAELLHCSSEDFIWMKIADVAIFSLVVALQQLPVLSSGEDIEQRREVQRSLLELSVMNEGWQTVENYSSWAQLSMCELDTAPSRKKCPPVWHRGSSTPRKSLAVRHEPTVALDRAHGSSLQRLAKAMAAFTSVGGDHELHPRSSSATNMAGLLPSRWSPEPRLILTTASFFRLAHVALMSF